MRRVLSLVFVLAISGTSFAEVGGYYGGSYRFRDFVGSPFVGRPFVASRPIYGTRLGGVIDGSSIPAFTTGGFAISPGGFYGFTGAGALATNVHAHRQLLADQAAARRNRLRPIRQAKYAKLRAETLAKRAARRQRILEEIAAKKEAKTKMDEIPKPTELATK